MWDTWTGLTECALPVSACVLLTVFYVASLYVWNSEYSRNHPSMIKRRFFSAFCMMLISPFFMRMFLWESSLQRGDIYSQLGLRSRGLLQAIIYPICLTMILFLGPLTMQFFSGILKLYTDPMYWLTSCRDLVWIRNYFAAPLSEEWVFRACMMPLLLQCLPPLSAVFFAPLLFGIAHFHHMLEQMKHGTDFKTALTISTFQFTYTSLFGAYSAFLFARTGHFAAPLVAHMFCNHMGFPNLTEIGTHSPFNQFIIVCNFFIGLVLWCILLRPMTDPSLYHNRLHWLV